MTTNFEASQDAVRDGDNPQSGNGTGAGQRPSVRLQVNDRDLQTLYANAFRINSSPDELFLDLGINTTMPAARRTGEEPGQPAGQVHFDISHRVVLNYYTAKRLAMVLGNLVRQHEQRFGELKLDVAERVTNDPSH
jgi:hypothetical protein